MCFVTFREKQQLRFFIKYLHIKFHSFLGFQHGNGSSVKAIKLAILVILGLSFLNPKHLCLPNQLSRGYWQKRSVSTYLTWCQRRNLHIMPARIWNFFRQHLLYISLALLNRIQPILERLKENITKAWNLSIIDKSKWC